MKQVNPYDRIRRELECRRSQLVESLRDELRELRNESDEQSWEDGEEEIDSMSDDVSSGLAERASDELRQIGDALQRLDDGTYGLCEICGHGIASERLRALPFTSTCIGCQQAREENLTPVSARRNGGWPVPDWRDNGWRPARKSLPAVDGFTDFTTETFELKNSKTGA